MLSLLGGGGSNVTLSPRRPRLCESRPASAVIVWRCLEKKQKEKLSKVKIILYAHSFGVLLHFSHLCLLFISWLKHFEANS